MAPTGGIEFQIQRRTIGKHRTAPKGQARAVSGAHSLNFLITRILPSLQPEVISSFALNGYELFL